jgi:hypothetical protein
MRDAATMRFGGVGKRPKSERIGSPEDAYKSYNQTNHKKPILIGGSNIQISGPPSSSGYSKKNKILIFLA